MVPPAHPPRRQARSVRNDQRILDAAAEIAAGDGWAALSPTRVAKVSGLSQPAVAARFSGRSTMAADLWRHRLNDPLEAALTAVLDCAGQLLTADGDAEGFTASVRPFLEPDATMEGAAELLVAASFDDHVLEAIQEGLGGTLEQWLTPRRGSVTRAQAARRAYLVGLALGLLLETRRQPELKPNVSQQLSSVLAAMRAEPVPVRLPALRFAHWDQAFDFATGDPLLDRLLDATLAEIGRRGFDATTVDDIATAAGHTKGLVFSRYPSKKQLFLDATERYSSAMFVLNDALYTEVVSAHSPGVAEAAVMRETMRPKREPLRVILLEQHRLAWHDAEMRATFGEIVDNAMAARMQADPSRSRTQWQAELFFDLALGVGFPLLACLRPETWELPFQTVTWPLLDNGTVA